MKSSRLAILFITMLLLVATGFVFDPHAAQSPVQDAEKSLDIDRYSNEPLELVEFKV